MGVDDVEKGGDKKVNRQSSARASLNRQLSCTTFDASAKKIDQVLTEDERIYILKIEHGDVASVSEMLSINGDGVHIDINCSDPLGRTGLYIAIVNENIEMMELLLSFGIEVRESVLVAIDENYVEGLELLLTHEERTHKPGEKYSWESVDMASSDYTPDITPLILAAHKNNFEILKMLLSRGASIPIPHDPKCSCDECSQGSFDDSLSFSLSRINAFKALASPSLIVLTSQDPLLTAFNLSDQLKKLKKMESQFSEIYSSLRHQVQQLGSEMLDHVRTSYELEILLNFDTSASGNVWDPGEPQSLDRVKLAVICKQKQFVSHPNVQQLLASIWYEGLPGWRTMNPIGQFFVLLKIGLMFPVYSMAYLMAPRSKMGVFMQHPFVKFIAHSSSFVLFLSLLAAASQRLEQIVLFLIGKYLNFPVLLDVLDEWHEKERGSFPSPIELCVMLFANAQLLREFQQVYREGIISYAREMWNLADIFTSNFFMGWIGLRAISFGIVQYELYNGINPYYRREEWHPYDPYLISEGFFGTAMIASYLKLVHLFSINPHLGPLQISLGRMAIDIIKFLILYILVLFAFACGMNQLLWYYSELEYNRCYSLPGNLPDWDNEDEACSKWRRFANLFESSQSLFWASFGLVDLGDFDLLGIKDFTRFWGLLMFGSYSVCNIIVLLNMLIAMMSNSFQVISEKADVEWKFARTKLWLTYFDSGDTVPCPFNLCPKPKVLMNLFRKSPPSKDENDKERARKRYSDVVKCIVKRYIVTNQKKSVDDAVTDDDINEVRQDINKFRYELINILKENKFSTPEVDKERVLGKKSILLERRLRKGFNLSNVDTVMKDAFNKPVKSKDFFSVLASAINKKSHKTDDGENKYAADPIGSSKVHEERQMRTYKRSVLAKTASLKSFRSFNADELLDLNPKLSEYTPLTRLAYAKFKSFNYLPEIREREERLAESSASQMPAKTGGLQKLIRDASIDLTKASNTETSDNDAAMCGTATAGQGEEKSKGLMGIANLGASLEGDDAFEILVGADSIDKDDDEIELNTTAVDRGKSVTTGQNKTGWL